MASSVDLLIIGAGPAGLMMALWASRYNINARVVDEKSSRVQKGQADGLHPRTLEILDSFGLAERFLKCSYHVHEICSWNPSPEKPDEIRRTQRATASPAHLSRFPQIGLNQGATEQIILDHLEASSSLHVERNIMLETLRVDDHECDDDDAYPVHATLRRLSDHERAANRASRGSERGDVETVRAKYVVGCDGAHSWVRHQLNIPMEGEKTNRHFGVMDIVPLTDFPDIRESCVIHSSSGSVMTIPRENRLVRLYVQIGEDQNDGTDTNNITPEMILADAQDILAPYSLDFRTCDWYSIYTVGQRVTPRFSYKDRVFLAGDAVHTHSPTLGQGMNVSMQDAYNLGWKIGSVVEGSMPRTLLSTYNNERRPVALELIELDKKMARFYSDGPSRESEKYQEFRDHFSHFTSGVGIRYRPSELVASAPRDGEAVDGDVHRDISVAINGDQAVVSSKPQLAKRITIGERLPSHRVLCQAEANVVHVSDLLPSNGKWRIMAFAGNLENDTQFQTVQDLGASLQDILTHYIASAKSERSPIEVLALHSGSRDAVDLLKLHNVYHPWDDLLGWDYWKVYSDDASTFEPSCGSAYEKYGVGKEDGCVVVLRPDQHVSYIGLLGDHDALRRFFAGVMVPAVR